MAHVVRMALCLLVVAGALPACRADMTLFDFEGDFDVSKVTGTEARVSLVQEDGGRALQVKLGHKADWPGINLKPPAGKWDLSAFEAVVMDVHNLDNYDVVVSCRVDNPGADGTHNCNQTGIALQAGERGTLRVDIVRKPEPLKGIKLFGMRGYPTGGGEAGTRTIDPSNVINLVIFVGKPTVDHTFTIDNIRATGTYTPPPEAQLDPEKFFPFIDTFGQYIHRDWPGKTHSVEEMRARIAEEAADLAAHPRPANWDKWGGWADGPTLQATGFFRTEKYEGKWWLVDPDGKLFWSHGMDCVRGGDSTPIDDRATWFQDFPGDKPEFKEFLGVQTRVVNGYYAGKQPRVFNFTNANLKRKYGDNWAEVSSELAHKRLASWGLNTIANWSDPSTYLQRKTPYVVAISSGGRAIQGSQGYWGQFKDVFDPEFRASLDRRMAQEAGKSAGDPWCLGYFVDNELSWGDDTSLAVAALVSPPEQKAKQVFVEDLKAKYGEIDKLNEVWGTRYASWDALLQSTAAPDKKRAGDDLQAFTAKIARTYFQHCRDAVKAVAPHNLYLGCRFAWTNELVQRVACEYCDVVSYNLYRRSVADLNFAGQPDKPRIIGEFHFGALDRGLFHPGLVKCSSQQERAQCYKDYVTGCLRNPHFVGCAWFKYQDEPTTGRALDGENYQIGFVDCCDTPYPEILAACREVAANMYAIRAGRLQP